MRTILYAEKSYRYIASHGLSTAAEISKSTGISARYLLQVLKRMSDAGILRSERGRNGGYRIANPLATAGDLLHTFMPDVAGWMEEKGVNWPELEEGQ